MKFRKTFNRLIAARERQAQRYVNNALLSLDDETLNRAGYNRADLKKQAATAYPY